MIQAPYFGACQTEEKRGIGNQQIPNAYVLLFLAEEKPLQEKPTVL
jgi:hypothetical protein